MLSKSVRVRTTNKKTKSDFAKFKHILFPSFGTKNIIQVFAKPEMIQVECKMVAEVVEIMEVKCVLPGSTALPPAWLLAVSPLCSLSPLLCDGTAPPSIPASAAL